MKINVKVLQDYLKKVSLNATIFTLNLNFESNGMTTNVSDIGNTAMTSGLLKKEAFSEYEEIGEIFIKHSGFFISILNTFKDEVNISKIDTNTLKIYTSNREVYIMLAEKSICSNLTAGRPMPKSQVLSVLMTKSDLDRIVKDMSILDIKSVLFKKDNNTHITIQVGKKNEYDFTVTKMEDTSDYKFKVGIGANIVPFSAVVGSQFYLGMANDYPVLFTEDNDKMKIETIMAPFTEDE